MKKETNNTPKEILETELEITKEKLKLVQLDVQPNRIRSLIENTSSESYKLLLIVITV